MEEQNKPVNRSVELCRRVVTTESFIAEAKEIYDDKYDYSKVEYKNKDNAVTLVCRTHGDFKVYARDHLDGKGCPKCEKGEKFIKKLQDKFGDKFGLEQFVYESSTSPVTLICPTHGAFSRLPHQILKSSLGCPECANDIVNEKQEAAKKAMEGKRLNATKAGIERFRNKHPEFTDEHIESIVEKNYPNIFENNLEVAIAIVKELYRRQTEWTDESFLSLLHEMKEKDYLNGFSIEQRRQQRLITNVNNFIERLYKEAQTRTIYLSECPEYQDPDVKKYFDEIYSEKGSTLAQKFFYLLNNRALRDTDQMSGFVLPFHCYSEPNGDVVFTKKRRTRSDYDAAGRPITSERDISNGSSGCLGTMIIFLLSFLCFSLFSCNKVDKTGPFEEDKDICNENTDTILAHMNGFRIVKTYIYEYEFQNSKSKEGKEYKYFCYAKDTWVTNGRDTLRINTKSLSSDSWEGQVYDNDLTFKNDIKKIKRHNLLMKELFSNDSCFTLKVNSSNIIEAVFEKKKPSKPEPPLEDYGLDETDI